jgi:hypothetical protein
MSKKKIGTDEFFAEIILEASLAGQKAGDEWLKNAKPKYVISGFEDSPLLDLCGNAHIRTNDGRTKFGKYLKKRKRTSAITVPLNTQYAFRQEHGLQVAIAKAALKVLQDKYGIPKLYIWDYID